MEISKITVYLIATMLIATAPLVLAATEDNVIITFDPDGDIDINVDIVAYNFSSFVANTWSNSTGNTFTVYNNGTVAMDTSIKTNDSTDTGVMDLNTSAAAPGLLLPRPGAHKPETKLAHIHQPACPDTTI